MLHPQARALLDMIEARGLPPTHTLSPADARSAYRDRRFVLQPPAPDVSRVLELVAERGGLEIPLRLYKPMVSRPEDADSLPVLVYFHGGGWVIGDLDTHDVLCRQLCNESGCAVVAVDYRMGPENVFPSAADDCLFAVRWVRMNGPSFGLDSSRLAVGGDSAGGNLAAAVCQMARNAGESDIAFQLLIYPATDMRATAASHTTNGQGYLLTSDTIRYFHDHYIDDRRHDLDPRASPLLADSLAGLPPALVITAGFDPLRDEGLAYADRLSEAGVSCSYVCFERMIHGFITMGRVLDETATAVSLCASSLRRALARPTD